MILKFLFDRIVAFVGLLFLWPVLLIVAILVKVKMPGIMNRSHNSRQVAKCSTNLVHRVAGTKPSARYDSPLSDFKSQLGYAQNLGRGPLLAGQ